jgi:hypothetical protein
LRSGLLLKTDFFKNRAVGRGRDHASGKTGNIRGELGCGGV